MANDNNSGISTECLFALAIIAVTPPNNEQYWQVDIEVDIPDNAKKDGVQLDYRVITERIITHRVAVWLKTDDNQLKPPKLIARIRGNRPLVSIPL